jgi:hypothetical protein
VEIHSLIPNDERNDFIIQSVAQFALDKYGGSPDDAKGRLLSKLSPSFYDLLHDDLMEVYKTHNTFFENYAPEYINDGKPSQGELAKADFVGWSGLFPISVLLEYVFGIKPHAEAKKILWCIERTEKHGVEKYPFGTDGELTLICQARRDVNEKPNILFESNVPVELEIFWGDSEHRQSMTLSK